MKNVIVVGGAKGGVGKSMVSMSIIDWYVTRGQSLFLVETDTTNPDVGKVHQSCLDGRVAPITLDNEDGWLDMLDTIRREANDMDVIINTGARNQQAIREHGWRLDEVTTGTDMERRNLITFWPINTEPDGLQLLTEYMSIVTSSEIYVLRNKFFDAPENFKLYNESNLRQNVEGRGGTYDFPRLAKRVTDVLRHEKITVADALAKLLSGSTMELRRWRRLCDQIYDEVIGGVA